MAEGKGFLNRCSIFLFRECVTTANNRRLLYGLHLLVGLIAAVAVVVVGFQTSPTQGLINLIGALLGFLFLDPLRPDRAGISAGSVSHSRSGAAQRECRTGNANARDRIPHAAWELFVAADSIQWAFGNPR